MNKIPTYLVFLWFILFTIAHPSTLAQRRGCGTLTPTEDEITSDNDLLQEYQLVPRAFQRTQQIQIPVHFHVITSGSTGHVTDLTINEQIAVLNEAYNPHFRFNLQNITRTDNLNYFNHDTSELTMKYHLRKGGCDTLNIYSHSGYGFLGYAYYPKYCSDNMVKDGVMIDYNTLPGGSHSDFNLGDTLIHEVGHWFGLYHTFEGDSDFDGCSGDDKISDTPVHKRNFSCEPAQDSCLNVVGPDPISNYMNYTPDNCMESFTIMQTERMKSQWEKYRKPLWQTQLTSAPSPTPIPFPSCKQPQRHFRAEIQTGKCGGGIRFLLQQKKKTGKGWKNIIETENFNIDENVKIDYCLRKKFCYRYKLLDISNNNCLLSPPGGSDIIVYIKGEQARYKFTGSKSIFGPQIGKNCVRN